MHKKILSILLCLFMLFGVVGCVPGNASNQNVVVGEYEVLNDGKGFLTNSEWKKAFKCLDRLEFEMKEEKYTPTKECFVVKTKKNTVLIWQITIILIQNRNGDFKGNPLV